MSPKAQFHPSSPTCRLHVVLNHKAGCPPQDGCQQFLGNICFLTYVLWQVCHVAQLQGTPLMELNSTRCQQCPLDLCNAMVLEEGISLGGLHRREKKFLYQQPLENILLHLCIPSSLPVRAISGTIWIDHVRLQVWETLSYYQNKKDGQ